MFCRSYCFAQSSAWAPTMWFAFPLTGKRWGLEWDKPLLMKDIFISLSLYTIGQHLVLFPREKRGEELWPAASATHSKSLSPIGAEKVAALGGEDGAVWQGSKCEKSARTQAGAQMGVCWWENDTGGKLASLWSWTLPRLNSAFSNRPSISSLNSHCFSGPCSHLNSFSSFPLPTQAFITHLNLDTEMGFVSLLFLCVVGPIRLQIYE